jgi:RNA polymerase II subunit A-like phosphatase
MKMSTNIQPNEGTGGDDECRPLKTDILLPGEDWVVDKWTVSSGSSVRAGETIAFVCKRSDTNHSDKTTTAAVVAATAQHKRPTRKKKGGGTAAATVVAAVVGNKDNQKPSSNTSSTEKSAVPSLKNLLAAKNRTESLAEIGRTESSPITSDEKKFLSDTAATSITSKTNQSIPIRAPVTGLLRIYNSSTGEHHQQKLSIGVIEECLHPTFVDGMCVVCGTTRASLKENESKLSTSNVADSKTSQVTVEGGITMTVSHRESRNMALVDSGRLLEKKCLSLVLDLDHTLVHATSDARARQYLDPSNPQAAACGDIRTISLPMFEGADPVTIAGFDPQRAHMWSQHYVKLRPHVKDFLLGVQGMYELTVYTAGTRQYAEEIAMVLCRNMAGSNMDSEDLDRLRYEVKMAEAEYAKNQGLKDDKKRTIDQIPPGEGENKGDDEEIKEPPKKRKKVSFGFSESVNDDVGDGNKSDHMTKEKLESMQSGLRSAEDLELKARELRQQVFGSRIVSRTDVGDLGRDVKSLKRIFPCGGTMSAVVDDREDVWANAKDNSDKTIKGEPPDNLLLVKPYHWKPFVGFADINNAAGADLSGSGPGNESDPKIEADKQLLWTKRILEDLHQRYYRQSSEGKRTTVPETLKTMRREILMGSKMVLSGLVPLHRQSASFLKTRPPFVRYAQNLGAKVKNIIVCYDCSFVNHTDIGYLLSMPSIYYLTFLTNFLLFFFFNLC